MKTKERGLDKMKKIKKLTITAITALAVATATSSLTPVHAEEAQQAAIEATNNDKRMAQIGGAIRHFLGDKTPIAFKSGLKSGKVNAYYEGDSDNFTVYYSKAKEGKNFNDPSLKDATSYVTIEKKTYASATEAKSAINYSNGQAQMGLPKIQLGSGLTGTLDNVNGQKFIHWNSGKWSMTVRSTGSQDPTTTARKIVNKLAGNYLPKPSSRAAGNFVIGKGSGLQKQVMSWDKGNAVYTVKASDLNTLLTFTSSVQ